MLLFHPCGDALFFEFFDGFPQGAAHFRQF
jgi:hypothetical protein